MISRRRERSKYAHNRTNLSEKERSMRSLALCAALFAATAAAFAGHQETELTASARTAIEKAVLEVNAQMTRAAEDLDIDRLFSFMLPNDRGSIIRSEEHTSELQSLRHL